MDKILLKKILENKNKKKSFCLISQADVAETSLVNNEDIEKHKFSKLIKKAMTEVSSSEHHMFSIPLEVNINSGNNWGEAH